MSTPLFKPSPPVRPLPKLATPKASDLAARMQPKPPAQALLKPDMSSSEYIHALEQKGMTSDAINGLAHGMPERESVWYATQSSRRVQHLMTPDDKTALLAAEDWVKAPTPANQARAAAAAAATNHSGPGAWAAQGAAWSSVTPGTPAAPGLVPQATAGSVQLASAMEAKGAPIQRPEIPATPGLPQAPQAPQLEVPQLETPQLALAQPPPPDPAADAATAKAQAPFVTLGKDVAAGDNTWA